MGETTVRIKGVVIPAEWDSNGNTTGVAISAWDEFEYRIEKDNMETILFGHMHEKVEVIGELKETGKIKTIKVRQVHLKGKKSTGKSRSRNLKKEIWKE